MRCPQGWFPEQKCPVSRNFTTALGMYRLNAPRPERRSRQYGYGYASAAMLIELYKLQCVYWTKVSAMTARVCGGVYSVSAVSSPQRLGLFVVRFRTKIGRVSGPEWFHRAAATTRMRLITMDFSTLTGKIGVAPPRITLSPAEFRKIKFTSPQSSIIDGQQKDPTRQQNLPYQSTVAPGVAGSFCRYV
jgi:hypothetical protein